MYGIRILVTTEAEVYAALQEITSTFPGFLDHDYVAFPKRHPHLPGKELRLVQYVARKNDVAFEIQITTHEWNTANEELHAEYHRRKYAP